MSGKSNSHLVAAILVPVAVLVAFAYPGGRAPIATAGGPEVTEGDDEGRRAVLGFGGERGTGFSGSCVVDGEKRKFRGEAPERLEFYPGDGRLECEVRKQGAGELELVFVAGETSRSLQRIDGPNGEVEILYEDGDLSTAMISSSGSGSSSQKTIVSGSSRSVVTSSQQTNP